MRWTILATGLLLSLLLPAHSGAEGGDRDDSVTVTVCDMSWESALELISYIYDGAQVKEPTRLPECLVSIQEIETTRDDLRRLLLTRYGVEIRYSDGSTPEIRLPANRDRMCVDLSSRCPAGGRRGR